MPDSNVSAGFQPSSRHREATGRVDPWTRFVIASAAWRSIVEQAGAWIAALAVIARSKATRQSQ
ncbi:MAG: hypothetical protein JJD98_11655 [Polaromonas sp.]|nr:hypothetical protein [Polaromonas sp.]